MGVLLGGYIDQRASANLNGAPTYLDYIAPGLLAGTAMQVAVSEAMWPVMSAIKWDRTYHAMLATPLRVVDIMVGHLGYIFVRLLVTCVAFVLVLCLVGTFPFPTGAVLGLLAALLTGLALAAPVYAYSAGAEDEQGFSLIYRLGVMPMFLLSGAFFPVWNLATPLEWLAKITPLYHGVELCRMAALGEFRLMALVHLAYLLALGGLGLWWGARRLRRRLVV
jgi:lipooligosaccharide transport system permease protein